MAGPGSRTTQLFINYDDNSRLDDMGFSPIGEVVEGMEVVDSLHAGYGEGAPSGRGPDQGRIQREGNAYLEAEFPDLDWIRSATIVASSD
jgi:peptidyl-prolyl cis-trans isomerase A (cyclophilin A)